jgi:hypothetical protein
MLFLLGAERANGDNRSRLEEETSSFSITRILCHALTEEIADVSRD